MRLNTLAILAIILVPLWAAAYSKIYALRSHKDAAIAAAAKASANAIAASVVLAVLALVGAFATRGGPPDTTIDREF